MKRFLIGQPKILNKSLFLKRVEDILDSKIFSNNGPYTNLLETHVGEHLSIRYAIAVNNATSALEICLAYLKSKIPFGNIIVPSFTFAATVHSVVRAGFDPVFTDIGDDFCFDTESFESRLNKDVVGIIPCNLFGNHHDTGYFERYRDLFTLYDSSHAMEIFNEPANDAVGNFGNCEVFSCHPTKLTGGMEGGIITTDSEELYEFAIRYRNFGFDPDAGPQGELTEIIGSNFKINEISAAAALCQLENIEEIMCHMFDNFEAYKEHLPQWVSLCEPNTDWSNYSYVPIRVNSLIRDALVDHLANHGIMARTYFRPLHKSKAYSKYNHISLPKTEQIASEIICLPTGLNIDKEDIQFIGDTIRSFGNG